MEGDNGVLQSMRQGKVWAERSTTNVDEVQRIAKWVEARGGSAKVMTIYLATANLLSVCEPMVTMKAAGLDMASPFEAITLSSGTSFSAEQKGKLF